MFLSVSRLGSALVRDQILLSNIAHRLEDEGILRIAVHGRTLRQRYSGNADWHQIREMVDSLSIPVIANGDVIDANTARNCLEVTNAAGLMIGRAAIGNPDIFVA